MANWFTLSVNEILSAVRGVSVKFGDKAIYKTAYSYIDFADDELINKRALSGIGLISVRVPFVNATGFVVNWQTDIPPGETQTYADLFVNNVEAFVYGAAFPLGQSYSWTLNGDNNVDVVTFDWGGAGDTGYIKFG